VVRWHRIGARRAIAGACPLGTRHPASRSRQRVRERNDGMGCWHGTLGGPGAEHRTLPTAVEPRSAEQPKLSPTGGSALPLVTGDRRLQGAERGGGRAAACWFRAPRPREPGVQGWQAPGCAIVTVRDVHASMRTDTA